MTFAEWEQTAETIQTLEVGRNIIRDIYPTPNGIELMHDVCMPHNPFAKSYEDTVVGFTLAESQRPAVEAAGGKLNTEDYYTEEGYGVARFYGEDCLRKAYDFSQTLK